MKQYESALSSWFRLITNEKEKMVEDCPEGEQKLNTLFASFCVSNRHTLPDAFAHPPTRTTLIVNGFILDADEETQTTQRSCAASEFPVMGGYCCQSIQLSI